MKLLVIKNAIIWAIVLLVSAILFKDSDVFIYLFFLLIGAATITNTWLVNLGKQKNQSCSNNNL